MMFIVWICFLFIMGSGGVVSCFCWEKFEDLFLFMFLVFVDCGGVLFFLSFNVYEGGFLLVYLLMEVFVFILCVI